ncbi:TetR/AcrR family transcriptional regulator [Erythrobacter sp. Alg231-14]|uniref:TetR/AcrR family transcriptional regulator n=1 Tax=Erythrobacter sp. Alg231-14 TaxID=1922225 RepID=UPI00307BE6EC
MLIAAAEEQFDTHSYAEVSMESIGKSAGLSGPAIYNHFASKDDLFLETIKGRIVNYNRAITIGVNVEGDWKDKYNNLLIEVRPFQGSQSGFQSISGAVMNRLRDKPEKFAELRELREESSKVFRGLVKEAVDCGDLSDDVDISIAGDLLMAITVGAINTVSFYHSDPRDMPTIVDALKALLGTRA